MEEKGYFELRTESEALARGANLSEKIPYSVFQTIRTCSHPDKIKTGAVFHIGSPISELGTLDYRRNELKTVLEELIKEKLIIQVFYLRFDPTSHSIRLVPCYIARPEDDRLTTEQLYKELLMQSVLSIEEYIKTTPGLDRQKMWKDLEADFQSKQQPDPAGLPECIFDPLHSLDASGFDFVPPADMIKGARQSIREELIRRKLILPVVEYGWMPLRQEELIRRFEIAQEFLNTRLVPAHRSNGDLMNEIRTVQASEETYYLDGSVRKSAEYGVKKATALKKHLMSGIDRKNRIPGSLAIETVLGLYNDVEKQYTELWQRNSDREYKELRNSISGPQATLHDRLRFFEEEEVEEISPEVWRRLISSVDFMHSTYERTDGTCNVLTQNDLDQFPAFVKMLMGLDPSENWKILAFRGLVDRYEATLQPLFYDNEFMESYGMLLRKAYWSRIPWYFRLLMLLGIKGFMDSAFQSAKQRITQEQTGLAGRNQKRRDQADRQRIIQKKEKSAQSETLEFSRRIIEAVERMIYEELNPPLISDVKSLIPDGQHVESFIESQGFRTVQHQQSRLLLFPVDFNWRSREAKLRRFLDRKLAEGGLAPAQEQWMRAVLRSLQGAPLPRAGGATVRRQMATSANLPDHGGDY
ncbi:MAG: hypothetical protein KDK23_09660 [Leptospiraceae bacterium]|nr:hypothetical protein [Leptospiraceae bacterium]